MRTQLQTLHVRCTKSNILEITTVGCPQEGIFMDDASRCYWSHPVRWGGGGGDSRMERKVGDVRWKI